MSNIVIIHVTTFFTVLLYVINGLTVDNWLKNLYKREESLFTGNSIRKYYSGIFFHMKTLHEIITFILTAAAYLLFHLGKTPSTGSYITGTMTALLSTLPFEIAFTYFIILFIRRTSGGSWPPWDRILRIFFTVGIIFGLIYNLYIRGIREQERLDKEVTVSHFQADDTRKVPLYWA